MLLSLDIAHNTGWAKKGTDGVITFGTRIFSAYSCQQIIAGRRFRLWLNDFLDEDPPEALITERIFFKHQSATWLLAGLAWEAQRAAEERGIPHFDYQPQSIKLFMTGHGRAKKPEMVQAARLRGFNVHNDHEADAIATLLLHEKTITKTIDPKNEDLFNNT